MFCSCLFLFLRKVLLPLQNVCFVACISECLIFLHCVLLLTLVVSVTVHLEKGGGVLHK